MPTVKLQAKELKPRRAARVLVVDLHGRVLLFEYEHNIGNGNDALAGKGSYYTIPGGKAIRDETFADCARRELMEETGITDKIPELVIAIRQAPLMMSSGNFVLADEQYFAVFVGAEQALDTSKWTTREKQNIKRVFWATPEDLAELEGNNLWPSTLRDILVAAQHPEKHELPLEYRSTNEKIGDVIVEIEY